MYGIPLLRTLRIREPFVSALPASQLATRSNAQTSESYKQKERKRKNSAKNKP